MKANERLLAAIGEVDPRYAPELLTVKKRSAVRWACAAAGICAVLLIGTLAVRQFRNGRNPAELLALYLPVDIV